MTPDDLRKIVDVGYERRGIEFKPGGLRTDTQLFAWVVRAALGMANRRDGGLVIIGVSEQPGRQLAITGVTAEQLASWSYDDFAAGFAPYADPYLTFEVETVVVDAHTVMVLTIKEFENIPVLCRRDYGTVLRDGACYVRPFRKPETSEIPSAADVRELLDIAVAKRTRRFIQETIATGAISFGVASQQPTDDAQFERQAEI